MVDVLLKMYRHGQITPLHSLRWNVPGPAGKTLRPLPPAGHSAQQKATAEQWGAASAEWSVCHTASVL